jgi:hypothetical protein
MSINASSFSAGYTGCVYCDSSAGIFGKFRGFVVNDDCVIDAWNYGYTSPDATWWANNGFEDFIGKTLTKGMYISVPDGFYISNIILASGSIILYNA